MSKASAISPSDRERLIQACLEAKERAYCPYSKFRVGAALLTAEGEIITGCNVENASYGGTICAERTALLKAVSEGKTRFASLAVSTDVKAALSPCGLCRQVIREFCSLNMPILLVPSDYPQQDPDSSSMEEGKTETELGPGGVLETTLGVLLPYSFGPEQLELPR